ncbi:MAG: 2-oxoglutarate and iron-dependent oxygenase domain-containing protein [Nannocystaceae bacterium]
MTTTIPILDFRRFAGDRDAFARDLGGAWTSIGFVGVREHGVETAVIDDAYAAVKALFELPLEDRLRYASAGDRDRGYIPFGVEHARDSAAVDLKEFWQVGRELAPESPHRGLYPANVWPAELPEFRPRLLALYAALEGLGDALLRAIAVYLDLPEDWFEDKVDHGNSVLRPIHYPPIAGEPRGVRSASHEDINFITLLVVSGEPGLQVLTRQGEWIAAPQEPGTILVNVGDMLQRYTNHVLRSTTHRVVNPPAPFSHRSRFSMPFFLHPNPELLLETLPTCVGEGRPDRYPVPISADAFLGERLREIGLRPAT